MKILFLTYQGDIAGSTYSISYLATGLAKRGHTVYVGCRKESLLYSMLKSTGVKCIDMPFKNKLDFQTMKIIRDLVKSEGVQIISAQSSVDRYIAIFSRLFYRLPVVVLHTRRQMPRSDGGFLQSAFYTYGTDLIIAVSNGVHDALHRSGIPKKHLRVIFNGTPTEKYSKIDDSIVAELRSKHSIMPEDKVIGCIARKKKQYQIINALKSIAPDVKVILVGMERDPEYDTLIRSLNLQHTIHFTGTVDPKTALHYYRLLNVYILPSTTEGLSQAVLEAMAMGVPVIATKASGNTDIIDDGVNGFLFDDEDYQGIADKVNLLFDDHNRWCTLRDAGLDTAYKRFSLENTVRNYEQCFEELIEKRKLS